LGNNNLIDDATISSISGTGNVNQPALLDPLGNYGGPTQTISPMPGSPAINGGGAVGQGPTGNTVPNADQRGIIRPQGAGVDIGAFESQGFILTKTGGDGQSTLATAPFPNPLAVTVASAHGEPANSGAVTFTVAPNGGAAATFGTLPGCTLTNGNPTATCTIAGGAATTPSLTANATVGSFTVTAAASGAPTQTFTLTITAPTIAVSPGMLPGGVRNIVYPSGTTLTATGGTAPYTFVVTGGTFTPGLALDPNGALAGTPTSTGAFTFTVTVTDRNGFTGTQQYTITISPAALVSIAVTPNTMTLKVGGTQQLTVTATYADNSTQNVSTQATWNNDALAVVAVDGTGKVTAQTGGTAHLSATYSGMTSNPATVAVLEPTLTGITVNPSPASSRSSGATSVGGIPPNPAPSPAPSSGGTTGSAAPAPVPAGR
jgi:hypothetical protein